MTTALLPGASAAEPVLGIAIFGEETELVDRVSAALEDARFAAPHRCKSLSETLDACAKHADVDLVVVGARRSDPTTLDAVRSLSHGPPGVRIVMVCGQSATGDIRRALDAGASGFVLADEVDEVLGPVLRLVRAGQVSVPGLGAREVGKRVLTSREKQVLGLVVAGMTNAEIASRLFLAESTVKSHLSSAFAKLGVSSRNEATALLLDPVRGSSLGIPAQSLRAP
jgi:DNA-binding NarL/FixJ family response regulator